MRRTLESDHSSSSYEFYASRSLSDAEKKAVKRLSGKTARGRKLEIQYMGEREIDYSVENKLLAKYYDIEVSESYDWWTSRVALDYDEQLWEGLKRCEDRGDEDLGVDVEKKGDRIIVSFYYAMDYGAAFSAFGEDPFEGLADLFEGIREDILAGDFSALVAIGTFYDAEIECKKGGKLSKNARTLKRILGRV